MSFQAPEEVAGRDTEERSGGQGRREGLAELIGFVEPRLEMMQYGKWSEQYLAIASGQVQVAARYLGEC